MKREFVIQVRVSEEERAAIRSAAGGGMSGWCRRVLLEAAGARKAPPKVSREVKGVPVPKAVSRTAGRGGLDDMRRSYSESPDEVARKLFGG